MRLRRWLKRTLIVTAVLFVILISLNLILTAIWSRQIDRKLAELRAKGEPVTFADLIPKSVPDEENAAPLYHKALAVLSDEDHRTLSMFFSDWTNSRDRVEVDAKIKTLLSKRETIVSIIKEATRRPHCVAAARVDDSSLLYERGIGLSSLALYLASCASVEVESGDIDTAVDDVALCLQMSSSAGPLHSPQSAHKSVFRVINQIVNTENISPEDIQRLHASLCKQDPVAKAIIEMQINRVLDVACFDYCRRNAGSFVPECILRPDGCSPTFADQLYFRSLWCLWKPFAYRNELRYLEQADNAIRRTALPYKSNQRWLRQDSLTYTLVTIPLRGFEHEHLALGSQQAQIGLAQTTLALKAYKNRHGTYPVSLKELKAYPGWKLPKDPFSGKSFGYKRIGQGFRVWSWGEDLVNDGGRLDSEISGPGTAFREDMVWIVER